MKSTCFPFFLVALQLFLQVSTRPQEEGVYTIEVNEVEQEDHGSWHKPQKPQGPKSIIEEYGFVTGRGRNNKPSDHTCVELIEEADPDGWKAPNSPFICTKKDHGIKWHFAGKLPNMDCTYIPEPADQKHTWMDNFLCVPLNAEFRFIWSYAGKPMEHCFQIPTSDPNGWDDNWLCPVKKSAYGMENIGMEMVIGTKLPSNKHCVGLPNSRDPDWRNVNLCFNENYGVKWNDNGPIANMDCTQIIEPSDSKPWNNCFLCVPKDNPWHFHYDIWDPLPNMRCTLLKGKGGEWHNNYVCY